MSKILSWKSQSNQQTYNQEMQQPNPNPSPGIEKSSQQSQQQPQAQQQQQQDKSPLANYTLPGVIHYLTSEFTNLERYKIMNNLEKSEMKYRITHLQGELNSMKYLNEQQKVTIQRLEKENAQLKGVEPVQGESKEEFPDLEIPEVDLQVIKDSRYQLTKSMKEVIHLLRSPVNTNIDFLDLPNIKDTDNSFDELFSNDKVDHFVFNGYNKENKTSETNGSTKDKSSYVDSYFNSNNDPVDEYEASALKSDPLDNSDAQSVAESEAETVILDGSSELRFDSDIEPNVDDKPISDPSFTEHKIILSDADYEKVRVFNNPHDDLLIYINYENVEDPDKLNVTLYDLKQKKEILGFNTKNFFTDKIESMIDLYCMSYKVEDNKARLVAVNKTGEVSQIVLDGEDSMSTTVLNLGVHDVSIFGSRFIPFSHKNTVNTNFFGLVVSLGNTTQASFKVYELIEEPRNTLRANELGAYTKGFFKNLKSSDNDKFEIVKWFKAEASPTNQTSPKSKKTHKRSSSAPDSLLSPYQLVIKLDKTVFVFNIVSKSYTVLTNYCQDSYTLEGSTGQLIVKNNIDNDSFQLEIYDLTKSPASEHNLITCDTSPNNATYVAIPTDETKSALVAVEPRTLSVYNDSHKLLDSKEISHSIYRIGNRFAVQDKVTLWVYEIEN